MPREWGGDSPATQEEMIAHLRELHGMTFGGWATASLIEMHQALHVEEVMSVLHGHDGRGVV